MLPNDWDEVLASQAFVISMDQRRYTVCEGRARKAGYTQVSMFPGVNRDSHDDLTENWAKHPFLPKNKMFGQHPAAVMLAHLNLLKHVIDIGIPFCTIFEDDMLFHTRWHELASKYYKSTPMQADMIFMGHHCGNVYPTMHIAQVPVYCLNAYIITLDGAKKLYDMVTQYPYDDFGVIDMMLARLQTDIIVSRTNPANYWWYAWNTDMFPDPENDAYKHKDALHKDKGLVFQQNPYFEFDHERKN